MGVAALGGGFGVRAYMDSRLQPETERWLGDEAEVHASTEFKAMLAKDKEKGRDWSKTSVSVYPAPNPRPDTTPISLKDLSDRAQAQAVDFVVAHPAETEATWLQLTKTLTGVTPGIERKDPYRVERRLVATVARGLGTLPGDRLLWTRIFVQPINFRFAGYTVAATDNKAVRVASVENTQNSKLTLDVMPSLPGLSKQSGSQAVEQTHKATADVNEQYQNLGIDINPNFLRIFRESGIGTDIAGNTSIDLSIVTDPALILSTEPGAPNEKDPDDDPVLVVASVHLTDGVKLLEEKEAKVTILPQNQLRHCALKAKVWMLTETRHIVRGRSHLQEGRHEVNLEQEFYEPPKPVTIVYADDISPAVWSIQAKPQGLGAGSAATNKPTYVTAKTEHGLNRKLVFTDYTTASELTHWLKAKQRPTGSPSGIRLNELIFDVGPDETLIPTKETKDENACKPPTQEAAANPVTRQ